MNRLKTNHLEIISVPKIKSKIESLKKLFSPDEIKYCSGQFNPAIHYAARLAAKKAFCKLYKLPDSYLGEIAICRAKDGSVSFHINKELAIKIGFTNGDVLLSIAHTDKYSAAFAVKV